MNDRDYLVEMVTEKDVIVLSFASYGTAEDFVKTVFLGLRNAGKEQVLKVCISEEKETP